MTSRAPRVNVFHAHVYWSRATREVAREVQDRLIRRFGADCRWREGPIGPHTRANVRVRFAARHFGRIVPWLMLHRRGLSVLVHPYTPDGVRDHSERALWLGKPVALKLGFLRRRQMPRR